MESTTNLITMLVLLLILSAFFSATETAFSSVNKIRLKHLANNGSKQAAKTLVLAEKYSTLISTILIGNNVVNIASASFATILFIDLVGEEFGVGLSTLVMTILVLIFGEITPKNMAKQMPEAFAMAVTPIIGLLVKLLLPISFVFELWQKFIIKLFKISKDEAVTSDELVTLIEETEAEGGLKEHESDLIVAAIEFNDLEVKDILKPRVDVIAIEKNMTIDAIANVFKSVSYSRLPVYEKTIDNIVGIIHEKDFYHLYYQKSSNTIESITNDCIYTNPKIKISALLKILQKSKMHMAVVLDEFGGTSGIITMEDILEELVGDIYDEHDEIEEYYTQLTENSFLVLGDLELDNFFETLGFKEEENNDYITVSGWIIHKLDKMPEINDQFDYYHLTVKVTKTDGKLVEEAEITIHESKINQPNEK